MEQVHIICKGRTGYQVGISIYQHNTMGKPTDLVLPGPYWEMGDFYRENK